MPINKQKIGDLVLLENISDDEINQVLKSRYSKDDIYTVI